MKNYIFFYLFRSYPLFGEIIGWMLALVSVIWIPGVACYKLRYCSTGSFTQRIRFLITPDVAQLRRVAMENGIEVALTA